MVDRYAGDEAWTQWFERCQVPLCDEQWREPLWVEIESALKHAISKKKIRNGSFSPEYTRNYFDTYFKLRGEEDKEKPRKMQIKSRISTARNGLRGVVLGSLLSGEVQTMAREIKVLVDEGESVWTVNPNTGEKELRIRSYNIPIRTDDGSEIDQDEVTDVSKVAVPDCIWTPVRSSEHIFNSDKQWFLFHSQRFIDESAKDELGGKNCCEKRIIVAAMLYVYAHKIPRQRLIVETLLHVKHVGAKKKIDKMIERLKKYCKKNDIRMCDQAFVVALIESANRILKDHLPALQAESKI